MSLINQMLQELDARGNQPALGGVLQGQVRAVPQRRGLHPAWWLAMLLVGLVCGGGLWAWLGHTVPATEPRLAPSPPLPSLTEFSLKITSGVDTQQAPASTMPSPIPETPSTVPGMTVPTERNGFMPQPAAPAAAPVQATPPAIAQAAFSTAKGSAPVTNDPQKASHTVTAVLEGAATTMKGAQAVNSAAVPAAPFAGEIPAIAKQVKELTPRQLAENEYRKASGLIQQGRTAEAISALEQALQLDSRHAEARQTLAALLIQSRRQDDAARTLREGLQLDASQTGLAMILSRLQLERGELKPAIETLQRSLPHAGERAEYLAFLAALLQRDGRHKDAIDHYAQALRKSPGNGLWLMGQGISLQAENRIPEAIDAYKRARAANNLSTELKAFVEERLNSL